MNNERILFNQVKRQEKQLATLVNLLVNLIENIESGTPSEQMIPLADKATRYILIETNLGVRFIEDLNPLIVGRTSAREDN